MKKDNLMVKAFATREEMGKEAAKDAAACFKKLLEEKEEINVIFAAAPSQNDVLRSLVADKTIEWNRINAYHMDEYIGLDKNAPQGFANFLRAALFDLVPFKSVNCIDVSAKDPEKEAERYSKILMEHKPDAVVLGIGENGHIAFNDPDVADFNDPKVVKPVPLDDMCRNQQVHDGCFAKLEDVPQYALTLTIPTLYNAPHLFCVVPVATKAQAVYDTVNGPISEKCPASIMRKHGDATLYLDADSSKLLKL
ncbi:MAG: glucosamine-6-phosphate deaminase [Bacilli bacterium]|nr:glucosamine-6-phosphate deaminase [Bacilli bacterium]